MILNGGLPAQPASIGAVNDVLDLMWNCCGFCWDHDLAVRPTILNMQKRLTAVRNAHFPSPVNSSFVPPLHRSVLNLILGRKSFIASEDLDLGHVAGGGGYSDVLYAKLSNSETKTNREVAIKRFRVVISKNEGFPKVSLSLSSRWPHLRLTSR